MKKANNAYALLGILAILLGGAAFGLFAAPAVTTSVLSDGASLYDFVFGNASFAALESTGTFVLAFVVLVIACAFELIAVVFSFGRSRKFAGFLHLLAGILAAISAVTAFLTPSVAPAVIPNVDYVIAYGAIASGAVLAAQALVSLGLGVTALFLGKKK